MNEGISHISGIPVKVTEAALETTDVPRKRHSARKGGGAAYHRRIQKKWIKRFGYKQEPCIFKTNFPPYGEIFWVHPAIMPRLREAFARTAQDPALRGDLRL